MKLKPYAEYKDSGVPWLGMVPEGWEVLRAKYYFKEFDERSLKGDEELLSVSHITGVTPRRVKNVTMFKAESYVGSKICHSGDLVINTMWAWMAALGIARQTGIVSPSYNTYRIKSDNFDLYYLDKLLRLWVYKVQYHLLSTGVRSSRLRLYPYKFFQIQIIKPPLDEQIVIARYLRYKSYQIAKYIKAKKRLIEVLKEQKQVIINDAVTGKIDVTTGKPYPKYKDSGVEWLGQVPEGWEVRRLRFLATISTGDKDTVDKQDNGKYPLFVRSQNVERINSYTFDGEAVLTAGDGAGVGKVFHYYNGKFDYHQRVYKFSNFRLIIGKFFYYYMKFNLYKEVIVLSAKSTVESLRYPMLQNFAFCLPTNEEQVAIIKYIEKQTGYHDLAITRAEHEIALMQEYRDRLMSDVVTGKVDVRSIEVPEVGEVLGVDESEPCGDEIDVAEEIDDE